MSDLKVIFRKKQNKQNAQALLELTIWGGLMLVVASMIVSYIMYLIYRQDLMIRNFRSAVRFAADKGATGDMVYQVMVEHRRIPSIGPNFMSGYREIQHVIGVIWSWNIAYKEKKKKQGDPKQTVTIVRYIVDGKNVSKQIPKNPNADNLLPSSLSKDTRDFLVLSVPPEEYVLSKKHEVLSGIRFLRGRYVYELVKGLFNQLEKESYVNMSTVKRSDYLQRLQKAIDGLQSLGANYGAAILSDIYDYLANEKWRGDVDSIGDLLGRKILIQDQRIETIQFGPNQKQVDVNGNYTVTHETKTTSGNVEITWQADNENIREN